MDRLTTGSDNSWTQLTIYCVKQLSAYLQRSEMYDAVNIWMRLEDLIKVLLFPDIDVEVFRSFAADELNAIDDFFRSIVEIVHNHDFVVSL